MEIFDFIDDYDAYFLSITVDNDMGISNYIISLGYTKGYIAELLCRSEIEVEKWLSGNYNFSLRLISKIEAALDIEIIKKELF